MTDEQEVRAAWDGVHVGEITGMIRVGEMDNVKNEAGKTWSAAAAFTRARRKQIAEVDEEIEWLQKCWGEDCAWFNYDAIERILKARQAYRAELARGMKEGK